MPQKGWIVASIVVVIAIIASWSFVIPLSSNEVYVDSDNVHNFTIGDEFEIMENQRVLIEENDIKIEWIGRAANFTFKFKRFSTWGKLDFTYTFFGKN